ncbi:hypothetical protein [Rheinheimera sp. 4Y26]|uniref:hypothetical protein n=1 Tax=Rheinheimera sp. 4Y26 TaxID=2977811 RepID=UPI0021B13297|nr:hypothetical protein [Rheinheimera sp. 4Y26]MCT6698295.1 hypothetical protein [Rheinheimera sp. 4Y26]
MSLKLLIGMCVSGVLLWVAAIQFKPLSNNWLVIDVPEFQLSSELAKQLPDQCLQNTELMLLQFQLDFRNSNTLQQSLSQLHDRNQDYFYQPLLDFVAPKSIALDPMTLRPGFGQDAVLVDRRVRRIEFRFGKYPASTALSLVYDVTVDPAGEIVITENPSNQRKTSVPPVAIQDPESQTVLAESSSRITDCMAAALPLLRSDLSWQFVQIPGEKDCELRGQATEQVQMKFLATCPSL